MQYTLKTNSLTIQANTLGAELQSIKGADGFEYLWQGNAAYWKGRCPILFPIIGGLPDDTYTWKGQSYQMQSHGFARRSEFIFMKQTEKSFSFRLSDNEQLRKQYPFAFDLDVIYTVSGTTLTEGFRIHNRSSETMPFSLGGHPAFNCPMDEGKKLEDYTIFFEKQENLRQYFKEGKLLSGKTALFLENQSQKHLSRSWLDEGAAILPGIQSDWAELSAGGRKIRVDFADFPDFGIWSAPSAPFICLEPWYGRDSSAGDSGRFEDKAGMILLPADEIFETEFKMTFS